MKNVFFNVVAAIGVIGILLGLASLPDGSAMMISGAILLASCIIADAIGHRETSG